MTRKVLTFDRLESKLSLSSILDGPLPMMGSGPVGPPLATDPQPLIQRMTTVNSNPSTGTPIIPMPRGAGINPTILTVPILSDPSPHQPDPTTLGTFSEVQQQSIA